MQVQTLGYFHGISAQSLVLHPLLLDEKPVK